MLQGVEAGAAGGNGASRDLSYVSGSDPLWRRWTIAFIEDLAGRRRFLPLYDKWRSEIVGKTDRMMGEVLKLIDVDLDIQGAHWPPQVPSQTPLVLIANHPFGIGDGIAALALAEQLGRPYRVLINNDLLKVPEIRPYSLPIDFSETREAMAMNLRSRAEARELLKAGVTIVVFPAGGVATAANPFGRAEELPWKMFTARLVQLARASVLPVYFEGQNSALFHLVSRFSLTLRLSLLVSEFRHFAGSKVSAHVGEVVPFEALQHADDRKLLTEELYLKVHRLAPGASSLPEAALKPTPAGQRPHYPWD